MKNILTIFTPTYNRCEKIKELYVSLANQTNKNFTWLIIDDGSTDDTANLVKLIKEDNILDIKYVYKENGGKHTAYNLACELVATELMFVAMDSDDLLKRNAVEKIYECWELKANQDIEGLVFLCENKNGEFLYSTYDEAKLRNPVSWQEAYQNNWFWGEAEYILRTEYVKRYKYPEYKNEKFFNEAYTYMQMNRPLVWNKESIYIRDYQQDGYTKNFLSIIIKSPLGYSDYNYLKYKYSSNLLVKIKTVLFYNTFSLLGKKEGIIKQSPCLFLSVLLMLPSFILSIGLRFIERR
ncbi:MAG: glycosyltransferase family 2 protein [Erysipelotrichales bacterium]|nr:glycosyltransferase family 2 protein [Erysipelotrichales bacterium]